MAPSPEGPLKPEALVAGYRRGAFVLPAATSGELEWVSPDPRAILPLDGLRVSHSLAGAARSGRFEIRRDTAFAAVVRACAEPRPGRQELWLDERMVGGYLGLHELGLAHSVEAWRGGVLVGGLFGVRLGGAFFGESMFHDAERGGSDASKLCLLRLVEWLRAGGFELLDVQYLTPHLARLGCIEIPRADFLERLERALGARTSWPAAAG